MPPSEPTVVAVADAALVARLAELLPDIELRAATLELLLEETARTSSKVVLCAPDDARAGLAALQHLRATSAGTRSLFVTSAAAVDERLTALAAGVDDVVTAPVSDAELAARLVLLLRRAAPGRMTRLAVGDGIELDLERRELVRDGHWVHLRPKEAGLLELLARSPGRAFSRDHIVRRVWGRDHEGDRRTVDVHVRWLRAKIEPDPRRPVRLLTVRGVGYRLDPAGAAPTALTER